MAKIAQEGVALTSKLWVSATKHTSVSALTETTIETFVGATGTKEVKSPTDLTGVGEQSNLVTVAQLGRTVASQYRAQPTPPTLTFSMVANPSDEGQALLLAAGTSLMGLVVEIVGSDGGKRYKAFNSFVDFVENVSADGAYTIDVTLGVEGLINTKDDDTA